MTDETAETNSSIASDKLRSFIERIERLEEEKATLGEDIKEIFAECKSHGFDVKTVRQVLKMRKVDPEERQSQEAMLDLYLSALDMR